MGGIAALLLIAAGGITYGWKPDNDGGVEYVIQIPPDQVQQLARIGQISSTIDPAVRGRVSRVVIQVGEGPVPRITPQEWEESGRSANASIGSHAVSALDTAPMPIPEMPDDSVLMPIAAVETVANQSVMKPQTGEAVGSGFSLPPSLGDAGVSNPSPRVDAAGREIGGASTGMGNNRLVIPPPATRTPSSATIPPFAGGSNDAVAAGGVSSGGLTSGSGGLTPGMATVRPGGPSTDPTTQRDRNWNTLGQNPIGGPTTDPVNTNNSLLSPRGAAGLSATDTFGRPPAAVSNPNWNNSVANSASSTGARDTLSQQNSSAGFGSPSNPSTATNNPFRSRDNGFTDAGVADRTGAGQRVGASRNTLTPAQIAAGAWSVDAYGNPIDREGRPIQMQPLQTQPPASMQNSGSFATGQDNGSFATNQGYPFNRASDVLSAQGSALDRNYANPNYAGAATGLQTQSPTFTNPSLASLGTPAAAANAPSANNYDRSATFGAGRGSNSFEAERAANMRYSGETPRTGSIARPDVVDPPSLVPRRGEVAEETKTRHASQPVITWLLLISFVGNVYLMFWMKKLLMRYRDLVAAKRVSDSRAAA